MADKIGMYVSQLKRYESGASHPTIQVLRQIVLTLNVSAQIRLFSRKPRGDPTRA